MTPHEEPSPVESVAADTRTGEGTSIRVRELRHSDLAGPLADLTASGSDEPVVVMPWVDRSRASHAARLLAQRAGAPMLLLAIEDDQGVGPVQIWNDALRSTTGNWFAYVADDAFPGRYWLRHARAALARRPEAHLLAFNDGKWFGQLAGFGLVRRQWLQSVYGQALFHTGYRQHYGDTELTLIARQQKCLAYDPHAMLIEVDALKDSRPVHSEDRQLFLERCANGFDGRVSDPALLRQFG